MGSISKHRNVIQSAADADADTDARYGYTLDYVFKKLRYTLEHETFEIFFYFLLVV